MSELFSSPQRSLMLAVLLLSCSIAGLVLTVQSITDAPAAQATVDHSLPAPTSTAKAPAPVSTSTLTLSNPVVTLDTDNQQLLAQLALHYRQDGKTLIGTISIAGQPRLDAATKQFYLAQPAIKQLNLAALSADTQQAIKKALNAELAAYFASQPVYAPMQSEALAVKDLVIEIAE